LNLKVVGKDERCHLNFFTIIMDFVLLRGVPPDTQRLRIVLGIKKGWSKTTPNLNLSLIQERALIA